MPFFRDTFTASINQNLEDHVPDAGTSWTELWATTPGTGWNVNASLDALTQDNATAAGAIYTADGVYPSAQYGVTVTVYLLYPVYLCVRIQDAENMYAVQLAAEGGGICQLYKKVSGAWTALGSAFDPPAAGSIVRLEIVDGTLSFYDDGVLIASVYDSDISAAGKAGLGCGGGDELVTPSDGMSTFGRLDNFSVNNLRDRSRTRIPSRLPSQIRGTLGASLGGRI